jgi:hypothetical protein
MGEEEGLVKVVADARYGEILGVHIIGPEATEMIAEASTLKVLEATLDELIMTVHAQPHARGGASGGGPGRRRAGDSSLTPLLFTGLGDLIIMFSVRGLGVRQVSLSTAPRSNA